ncbi:hypothetical protein H0H92_015191 [Tricholoma furcatifolium]|nr:hypothetical protein H0H92_015191 [Tricholoma furcatifolium]
MSESTPLLGSQPARKIYRALGISTLALLAASTLLLSSKHSRAVDELSIEQNLQNAEFSWSGIEPSETLTWHPCHTDKNKNFQCARLTVPLNYSDPSGAKAAIALTRLPSSLSSTDKYRGPILLNPGGPGGRGVDLVINFGDSLSAVVGPEFDLVGFDPRGIARSTSSVSFFDNALDRKLWNDHDGVYVVNASQAGLARAWAQSIVNGKLAWDRQADVLPHITTDQTARDMLSIVKAHGRDKILYWGFSYGTVLGATFASMFPDNIERLVIDGVVDIENYYEAKWSTNLIDTSKTMDTFYTSCHLAGPSRCAFYAPTPDLIAANLTKLYDSLRSRPVPVHLNSTSYGIVDYNRLRTTVFAALYTPWASYPVLAEALAALARGDGKPLFLMSEPTTRVSCPAKCDCGSDTSEQTDPDTYRGRDAATTILCNDGDAVSGEFEDLEEFYESVMQTSEWYDLWAAVTLPYPVTPLWAAKKTAEGFPGSVVLTQDSPGSYIRDYFVKGALPSPGTICPVVGTPFTPSGHESDQTAFGQTSLKDLADWELYEAVRRLSLSHDIRPFV